MRTTSQRSTVGCQALCLHFSYKPHHKSPRSVSEPSFTREEMGTEKLLVKGHPAGIEQFGLQPQHIWTQTPPSRPSPWAASRKTLPGTQTDPLLLTTLSLDMAPIRSAILFCKRTETGHKYLPSRAERRKLAWEQTQLRAGMRAKLSLHQLQDRIKS